MRPTTPTAPVFAVALTAALLSACRPATEGAEEPPLAGLRLREAVRVVTLPVETREMVRRLETTTRIESRTQVQVVPRLNGVVTEIRVEEGQTVEPDQVLAVLDDRELKFAEDDARAALLEARTRLPLLRLAVREAEERLKNAGLAYEQAGRDHERNLAIARGDGDTLSLLSQRDLDASRLLRDQRASEHQTAQLAVERATLDVANGEALVQRAELALERAALSLSYTRITSPIHGVIAERNVRVGETTGARVGDIAGSSGTPFVVTAPDDLRAVFWRPQRELSLFRQGSAAGAKDDGTADIDVEISAEALPGRRFVGRIERVSPTIDPASGNFRVTAVLEPQAADDPRARLLPGMLVRLSIVTERHRDALVVPKRAVRREGERSVVFAVRDGLAASVAVREGFSDDESVEITPLEGELLAVGEPVIVVGNRDLEDGARVSVRAAASEADAIAAEPELAADDDASTSDDATASDG